MFLISPYTSVPIMHETLLKLNYLVINYKPLKNVSYLGKLLYFVVSVIKPYKCFKVIAA